MTRKPKRLSGPALERFFRRVVSARSGPAGGDNAHLARTMARLLASAILRPGVSIIDGPGTNAAELADPAATSLASPPATPPTAAPAVPSPDPEPKRFDPYCIGLLPTYQREGAEGLRARLEEINSLTHLRVIARAQQVALPAELRGDDADAAKVRDAMVTAVARRIASRRAAAG